MHFSIRQTKGFTLIEVLIALTILSIALTAIIKTTSENIRGTLHVQNKTIASFLAGDVINQVRVGILTLPLAPDHTGGEINALGQIWQWHGYLSNTPNKNINEIHVQVSQKISHEKLAQLQSYLYGAK
jgi:general secretion pathway protein I